MSWRVAALAIGAALAAASLADLPALVRVLLVVAAFGAGIAHERLAQPLGRGVPAVDRRSALIAAGLVAAAVAVLLIPRDDPDSDTEEPETAPAIEVGSLPELETRTVPLGRTFVVAGAAFRVDRMSGARSVSLTVRATNRSRRRFDPTVLRYRLADAGGRQYYPDRSAGTGPGSLAATGSLARGETAEVRLGFQVSASADGLALVFEPDQPSSIQVRIPLAAR